jgi:hypothetical protein
MTKDQAITVFKNAAQQMSFVKLTADQEKRLFELAGEVKTIFEEALTMERTKKQKTIDRFY